MKIVNRKNIKAIEDACGELQEMYNSKNLSVSYAIIKDKSRPHKHEKLEEVYYIIKGKASIRVEDKKYPIKSGDVFSIPKNKYHNIEDVEEVIELIVVTNPKWDIKDVIY